MPAWRAWTSTVATIVAGLLVSACRGQEPGWERPAGPPQARVGSPPLHVDPGLAPFNEQQWDDMTGNGWNYLRRTSSRDDDVVDDDTAPFSPPRVLRIAFTPDMRNDAEPSVHWIDLPNAREVYAVWWIKLSDNWTPSPAGGGKMTFLHVLPNGQGQVYTGVFGASAPHRVSVNTEWEPYGQKVWDPNVDSTPINYGAWYRIEWYSRWDSAPGAGDGVMRWWVNGVLNGNHANVRFPAGGVGFHQFEFAPTLQRPPAQVQYMYVDHTYIGAR